MQPFINRRHLTAQQVQQRYGGISQMTLWRWVNNPNSDFPKPMVKNRRRYFDLDELDAFDARHKGSGADVGLRERVKQAAAGGPALTPAELVQLAEMVGAS